MLAGLQRVLIDSYVFDDVESLLRPRLAGAVSLESLNLWGIVCDGSLPMECNENSACCSKWPEIFSSRLST